MSNQKSSSPALVLLAWLFVAIPLGWGIYNTVRNSMKLFQTPPAHATWVSRPAPQRFRSWVAAAATIHRHGWPRSEARH